jgi:glycosyltransferase involved in cell wall biosynthesis
MRTAMKHDRHRNQQETCRGGMAEEFGSATMHALDITSTPASVCLSLAAKPAQTASASTVRHYAAGGRENGGGIGRLIGYIVETADQAGAHHVVTDTRGQSWFAPTSLARLFTAILLMMRDRIVVPHRIHHIHIAGRGSTVRKLILTAAARGLGCVHVLHLHDYDYAADFALRSPRLQSFVRHMFRGADRVIALGQRDRETLAGLLGVDADRIAVIHNCVPDPGPRRHPAQAVPTILFLGRLSERKGVPELLAALSSETLAGLKWRAVLAGDGPVEDYRRQAAAMGLSERVTMPGWLGEAETKELCARADILVLPSHAEGLAMAVLEGLAHGLAVVTTRVGAHEEVISDDTGIFVPAGDEIALADALARLINEPRTRELLSTNGRSLYLSRFSMPVYLRRLNELYDAVSARHRTVAGVR